MFIGIFFLVCGDGCRATRGPMARCWSPPALLVIVGVIDDRYNVGVSARLAATDLPARAHHDDRRGLYLRDIGDPFGTGRWGRHSCHSRIRVGRLSSSMPSTSIDGNRRPGGFNGLIGLAAGGLATGLRAPAASVAAMACGATLGFLLFNFPAFRNRRWRTFMGDAGSTLLGSSSYGCASRSPGRRQVAVPGRGALVCADARCRISSAVHTARGQGQDAVASGA